MSQLTEVGVGSFVGDNNLEINIPGLSESKVLPCNWGPGIGFYLCIIAAVILSISLFYNRLKVE